MRKCIILAAMFCAAPQTGVSSAGRLDHVEQIMSWRIGEAGVADRLAPPRSGGQPSKDKLAKTNEILRPPNIGHMIIIEPPSTGPNSTPEMSDIEAEPGSFSGLPTRLFNNSPHKDGCP